MCTNTQELWDRLIDPGAVDAMRSVQVPCKELAEAESAMVQALEVQGHLVPLRHGMPRYGNSPSAPSFIIPKTEEKCSLIFSCQLGKKKSEGPNPHMRLPNLLALRKKFLDWIVQPHAGACAQFLVKPDLTNCYPSLVLPETV